jgi:hypothetical protein
MLPASRLLQQDIGYTQNVTAAYTPSAQDITDIQGLGDGIVARYQQKWIQVETALNVFNYTNLDAAVKSYNDAGIDMLLQIQTNPGAWFATLDSLGANCTLQTALTVGNTYTSFNVSALNAEAFIPPGVTLAITYGGSQDVVTVAAPTSGQYYGQGATSINIVSHQMAFNHSINDQIYEATGGPTYPTSATAATFMGILAARYNGNSGHGYVRRFQWGNEEFDSNNRIGAQVVTANWNGTSSWDNGYAIAAIMFNQVKPAILDANPLAVVMFPALRRTGNTAQIGGMSPCIQHIQNQCQGAAKFLTVAVPEMDFHFYHGSDADFDGTLIGDPTVDTYFDQAHTQVNSPSIQRQVGIMATAINTGSLVQRPKWICGEFGWDLRDDGTGYVSTTNGAITANQSIGALVVNPLGHALTNAEQFWIDTASTSQFEQYYTFGAAALNATVVNLTTDPRGNGTAGFSVAQVVPHAQFAHSSGVNCYAQQTTDTISDTLAATYFYKLISAMRGLGGDAYFFTLDSSAVQTGGPPWPIQSTSPKSIVQKVSGVYTFLAPYATLKQLARTRW